MQEVVQSPLAIWQNFYVIIGTAAATLTGLTFIVITLFAQVRGHVSSASEASATFNTPNVVHFGAALLIAALLSALINKSLVLVEEVDGHPRYRLLETVRQYGQERLELAGDAALMRQLFSSVTVDYDGADLAFQWRHGGQSEIELGS